MVHRRNDLDASIKYYYLRTNLSGEAMDLIKSLPISAEQYDKAWTTLLEYYDSKRRSVTTLLTNFLNVKAMKSESAIELKRVASEFFSPLESFSTLGRTQEEIGIDLIVHLAVQLFDNETRKDWRKSLDKTNDSPTTLDKLKEFIKAQIENLENDNNIESVTPNSSKGKDARNKYSKADSEANTAHSFQTASKEAKTSKCILCGLEHHVSKCEQFLKRSISERRDFVKTKHACFNFLSPSHRVAQCKSRYTCFACKSKHHTTFHSDSAAVATHSETNTNSTIVAAEQPKTSCVNATTLEQVQTVVTQVVKCETGVLLATAQIRLIGRKDTCFLVKALIDPCSQVSLIGKNLCTQLNLAQTDTHVCIKGVGENPSRTASYKPPAIAADSSFEYLCNLQLADPNFKDNAKIELLLGASAYTQIIRQDIIKGSIKQRIAINSKLGWLLTGDVALASNSVSNNHCTTTPIVMNCTCPSQSDAQLSRQLQEFWWAEEKERKNSCSVEEQFCEQLYVNTTRREQSGRYVVKLPWKDRQKLEQLKIGNSFTQAFRALKRLESNFEKDPNLKHEYDKFMQEYISLGHMTLNEDEKPSTESDYFFLPHHGVWKESSSTTKLRTVFNGSSKLPTGESINELLYNGTNYLPHPVGLICPWRNYIVALSADLEKMFRHIDVEEEDRKFQTIIWRFSPTEPIRIYRLNTVTYGLTCSGYLAMRTLRQLANDYCEEYPAASQIINEEMYSDNVLTGSHSCEAARLQVSELVEIFRKGQMNLRKWSSSHMEALNDLPRDSLVYDEITLVAPETSVPVLGIAWSPRGDYFSLQIAKFEIKGTHTERSVLSRIARFFDPMGWLAPVIIVAKILMQSLWLLKLDWDDALPENVAQTWSNWLEQVHLISQITIPRWTGYTPDIQLVEIHGFADASKQAYGAIVYLRLVKDSEAIVSLQIAKTRVAPVKTLSIPRLELSGAVVLTRLVKQYLVDV